MDMHRNAWKLGRRSIHRLIDGHIDGHIVVPTWLRFQAVGTSSVKNVGRVTGDGDSHLGFRRSSIWMSLD